MMKKALITGLSGFTGKYLAAELKAAGYDVYGTGLTTHDEQNIHPLNLCDLDAVRSFLSHTSPSVVAHLAGISFVVHSNVEETYRTNIIGTRNLLHALSELKTPPKAVLLASSGNIYGNSSTDPIPETMPPSPEND